ncbi:hypothetical protein ACTXT7_011289 [Hymenolepis weldensis]
MLIHDDDDYLSRIRPGAKSFYKCNIQEELYHRVKRVESRFPGLITDRILLHDLPKLGPIMSSDDKLNAVDVFVGLATFANL